MLEMLRECSIKRIERGILAGVLLFFTASCTPKKAEAFELGKWIRCINEKAGIVESSETKPYIDSVDPEDEYFADVQTAVEWGVLNTKMKIKTNSPLTREWAAGTLMNLWGKSSDANIKISDIEDSQFKEQIESLVSFGIMKIDSDFNFCPEEKVGREEGLELLDLLVSKMNNLQEKRNTIIDWKDSIDVIEVVPESVSKANGTMVLHNDGSIDIGSILEWQDSENGETIYGKVSSVENIEKDKCLIAFEDPDIFSYTETTDVSGNSDIDFSKAQITDGNGKVIQESALCTSPSVMSTNGYQKSFKVNGYTVTVHGYASGVSAEVNRTLSHGSKLYAAVKVNSVHCDYHFLSKEDSIKNAYFKVKFKSEEDLGLKNGAYKNLYGDFSKVETGNFIETLKSIYQEKKDETNDTLTLAKITVPLPGNPVMNLTLNLDLHMSTSGRVQITLSQENELGCEVKDGKIRLIKEQSAKADTVLKSDSKIQAGIRFALNMTSMNLCDIGLNAGAKASVKTTVHMYDSEGKSKSEVTDVPADVADEAASEAKDVMVCGDIDAKWLLNVKFNSSKSLMGKLGINRTISLLSDEQDNIFPDGKRHIENFKFVDHCTRGNRTISKTPEELKVTQLISLKDYSIAVHLGESVAFQIRGLPDGYTKDDLIYISGDSNVASTDGKGNVKGISSGSTVVTIKTKDDKHRTACSIMVPQVS